MSTVAERHEVVADIQPVAELYHYGQSRENGIRGQRAQQ